MPDHILIADDDEELGDLLTEFLESEGFDVSRALDGETALTRALEPGGGIDAVVLDIMMPRLSGIEVLKKLRRTSGVPVLMLTARGDDLDRIIGLELGADDYLPKPCNPRELVARLRAILRRGSRGAEGGVITVDDLELHPASRQLYRDGERLALTSTEFSLAQLLLQRAGSVVAKRDLYLAALGREPEAFDRSVDMHLSNLRRKLGPAPGGGHRIETVRGIGYLFALPGPDSGTQSDAGP